jgi:type IV pilus assembly protein PilA
MTIRFRNIRTHAGQQGFSLIEVMVVVAIIGVLAAIAIPNYKGFHCKAKQSEAKVQLGAIRTAQKTYWSEHQTYATSLGQLAYTGRNDTRYTYSIVSADQDSFLAVANGTINTGRDVWRMTQEGNLTHPEKACD